MEVATRKALGERPEINNSISKRVVELRQAGMGDLDIANSLLDKGVDPTIYGVNYGEDNE
jgi:hypothetical protein